VDKKLRLEICAVFALLASGETLERQVEKITIDNMEYDLANASDEAKAQIANLQFVNEQLLQRNNELQIAETAKIGYSRALKRELEKIKSDANN
jgi:hypothetical protein